MTSKPSARIFVVLARDAATGVIFRRGPSRQVQLIKWDTSRDRFEYGQWLKGRIYERRCDLSPGGDKLIYLAAKWKKPIESWTAVSRPPFLTALALWPNLGAWGGGGLFEYENTVLLNHRFDMDKGELAKGFSLPKNIHVKPLGKFSGHGEDDPIYEQRLLRDGWVLTEEGKSVQHPYDPYSKIWITFDPPRTYRRVKKGLALLMRIKGYKEWNGPNYVVEYNLETQDGNPLCLVGRLDWADWDKNGDLLFAKGGKLFRTKQRNCPDPLNKAVELADFNNLRFEEMTTPKKALQW